MARTEDFANGAAQYQYRYVAPGRSTDDHRIVAETADGAKVGHMTWNEDSIGGISVHKDHQRKGVATAMYNMANSLANAGKGIPAPVHAEHRTPDSVEWIKKVGGKGAKRKDVTLMIPKKD